VIAEAVTRPGEDRATTHIFPRGAGLAALLVTVPVIWAPSSTFALIPVTIEFETATEVAVAKLALLL